MDDVKDFAKKYWPYIVGALVVLWLLMRSGGNSGGGGSNVAGLYAAQAGSAAQMAGINAQARAQEAALAAQERDSNRQYELQSRALDTARQKGLMEAQAQTAMAAGATAKGVLEGLYAPQIAAMQMAGYENAEVIRAAAGVAAAGFGAQAGMIDSTSKATQAVADTAGTWGAVSQGISGIFSGSKSPFETFADSATQLGMGAINRSYFGPF